MHGLRILKKSLATFMVIALTATMMLAIVVPGMAQEDKGAPDGNLPTPPSQQQEPTDPAELEAFLDELMAKDMDEHHIPGAVVSVVKDGELFFSKGYDYADLENKIPVDAE